MVKRSSCSFKSNPQEGGQGLSTATQLSLQLSHDVLVHVCLAVVGRRKGAQPGYRERMAKHHLHVHPLGLFGPPSLLLLQLLDTRLVRADGVDLGPEHDGSEDQEEETLEAEEDEEDDSCWWREVTALCPVLLNAENKMEGHQDECMEGY